MMIGELVMSVMHQLLMYLDQTIRSLLEIKTTINLQASISDLSP